MVAYLFFWDRKMKVNIFNKKLDFFLIKFPVFFPILYGIFLLSFPQYEMYLIVFTILLLAEPHFGATWPLLINSVNYKYFSNKKLTFFFGAFFILLFCVLGFLFFKFFFLLIFYMFNVFHVTRQSVGICKLYNKNLNELNFQTNSIYLINFLFFFIGLFRFYHPIINQENLFLVNIFILAFLLFLILYQLLKFGYSDKVYTFLTGMIIFYPICIVSKPIHAILWGVTMHYSQYLAITTKVYFGRKNLFVILKKKNFFIFMKSKFFIFLIFYSFLMTILSLLDKISIANLKHFLIIPIIGQMLHFYFDTFIWKFSDQHNRDVTLKYLLHS